MLHIKDQRGLSGLTIAAIITIIAVALGLIIYFASANSSNSNENNSMMQDKNTNEAMVDDEERMMEDDTNTNSDAMIKDDEDAMEKDDSTNTNSVSAAPGQYIDYTPAAFASASNEKRVLFFHATWCPTCKAANEAFTSRLDEIPSGVVILKTDYDSQTALKNKYDITYQHTFVQVDAEGNELAKWNGGDLDLLARKLQ